MSEQEFELRQTLPEEYKQIPDAYREKAVELYVQFQTGNYENTIKTARKLLEEYDDHETGAVRGLLGRALLEEGEYEEADGIADELIKNPDTQVKGLLIRAGRNYDFGEYEDALDDIEAITTGNHDELDAKLIQCQIESDYGDYVEARQRLLECFDIAKKCEDEVKQVMLLCVLLTFDTRNALVENLEEDSEAIVNYVKTHDYSKGLMHVLSTSLGGYSVLVNKLAWPRECFLNLVRKLEPTKWFTVDDIFIRSAYSSVESYEMEEDERFPVSFTHYAANLSNIEEEIPSEEAYAGLKELEDDSTLPERMKASYPKFYESIQKQLDEAVADQKNRKEKAIQSFMKINKVTDRKNVLLYLEFFRVHINERNDLFEDDLDFYYFDYPEEYHADLHDILLCYFTGNYAEAAERCTGFLKKHSDNESGTVQLIRAVSLANTGKTKDALNQAEKAYKQFDKADDCGIVYAYALLKSRNYRKAEKLLRGIEFPSEEPMLYCETYLEVLEKLDQLEKGIPVLEKVYHDCDFDEDEPDRSENAFYFVYHLMRMMVHIKTSQFERLEDDKTEFRKALYRRRPEGYTEFRTAEYVTYVCNEALGQEETAVFFKSLIEMLDQMRTFSTQKSVITSGYSACASYVAAHDKNCNPFLYDLALSVREDAEGTEEFYQYTWFAAEEVRQHPEDLDYFIKTYPELVNDAGSVFEKLRQDPEKEKRVAEQAIAKIASISSEAVRVFLKKNYEMYKKQQPAGWSDEG